MSLRLHIDEIWVLNISQLNNQTTESVWYAKLLPNKPKPLIETYSGQVLVVKMYFIYDLKFFEFINQMIHYYGTYVLWKQKKKEPKYSQFL